MDQNGIEQLALLLAAQCGDWVEVELSILYRSGARQRVSLPRPGPANPVPVASPVDRSPCAADILLTLQEAARRLTTTQLIAEMERQGRIHGESTVRRTLAELVAQRTLDNEQHRRPRGYGIPA